MLSQQTVEFKNLTATLLNEGHADTYGNPIQTVILPNYRYRCVTLPSKNPHITRMRIFLKPGTFINITHVHPTNKTDPETLEIGDFFVQWEPDGFVESEAPDEQIANDLIDIPLNQNAFLKALSLVLDYIRNKPEEWQIKQT